MYAVFTTGGKQHRVKAGDTIKVEKLSGDFTKGDKLSFDKVLLIEEPFKLGKPTIDGAKISATLEKIGRYKTVDVIKYKQKSRYFKKYGHRQPYFEIKIDSIN